MLGWKPLSLISPLTESRWVSSSGCCKCCINIVKISLTLHKKNPRPTLNKKTRLYGTNEITFFDSIHYILRKKTQIYNKKFLSDKLSVTKSTLFFFSRELQLITFLLLICDSCMSWSTCFITSLKVCEWFSTFDFVLFLLKFIFLFDKKYGLLDLRKHQQKTANLLKRENLWRKSFSR